MANAPSGSPRRHPLDISGWRQARTFDAWGTADRTWIAVVVVAAFAGIKGFDPGPRAAIGESEGLVFMALVVLGFAVFLVVALLVNERVLRRYPSRVRIDPIEREITLERHPRDRRATERWAFAELTDARKRICIYYPLVELRVGDQRLLIPVGTGEGDPLAASLMAAARAAGVPD